MVVIFRVSGSFWKNRRKVRNVCARLVTLKFRRKRLWLCLNLIKFSLIRISNENIISSMPETLSTTYTLIDGKKVSTDIKNEIAQKVAERKNAGKKIPHLA